MTTGIMGQMIDQEIDRDEIVQQLREAQSVHLQECPICHANQWEYFGGRFHFDLRVEYWICPECMLVGQSPMVRESVLTRFYEQYYRLLYDGNPTPTPDDLEFERQRGRNLLKIFTTVAGRDEIGRLLDVGSSAGGLLSVARDEFHASPVGIELNQAFSQFTRGNGFAVFDSFAHLRTVEKQPFELITASHVLEHIADLPAFLAEMHALVEEGGYLCLEVPHTSEGACFEILHLWGFQEYSLARLLANAGFETFYTTTHGYPRAPERANMYLVVVARKTGGKITLTGKKPTARQVRMERYLQLHEQASLRDHQRMLLKNTVKQLIGRPGSTPIAFSYFPSKLKHYVNQ